MAANEGTDNNSDVYHNHTVTGSDHEEEAEPPSEAREDSVDKEAINVGEPDDGGLVEPSLAVVEEKEDGSTNDNEECFADPDKKRKDDVHEDHEDGGEGDERNTQDDRKKGDGDDEDDDGISLSDHEEEEGKEGDDDNDKGTPATADKKGPKTITRIRYSNDFKVKLLDELEVLNVTVAEMARRHKLPEATIRDWVKTKDKITT
jgi:hypothetical protein